MSKWTQKTLREILGQPISGSRPKGGVSAETEGVPSLGGENILSTGGVTYSNLNRVPWEFYRSMPKGRLQALDVLINKDGAQTGKVGLYPGNLGEACINEHLFILRSAIVDQRFLYYAILLPETQARIEQRITGSAQPGLNTQFVDAVRIAFPKSPDQQRRIAEMLGTVDEVIEQTEALIAKQQQVKAGLMHDLFTRGVTASGTLRPPPTEAPHLYQDSPLGPIPKEWAVEPIEKLLERIIDYRGKTPVKTDEGIPLITAKNVRMGRIDPEPREYIAADAYSTWMTRGIPRNIDVLFTTEAPLGNVAQIGTDERVAFAQRVIILQPLNSTHPAFLKHLLMSASFQNSVYQLSSGTTALGVKQSEFRKVKVAHPRAFEEQAAIANRITALEESESAETAQLTKLRQEKQGLMQDLLTGRVPVPVAS